MNNILAAKLALRTLRKAKLRSLMTIFGVMIGIAMVIIVLSAGNGIKGLILGEISSFGDDWINTEIKVPSAAKNSQENAAGIARGVQITTLTYEDMEAMLELKNIKAAYAGITSQAVISYENEKMRPSIFGVTAGYNGIDKTEVEVGRFFTEEEERAAAQVVVLGSDIRENLFGNQNPFGKTVKISGKSYKVIGVMESIGATGFINMDEIMYLPMRTVQKKMMGVDHIMWMIGQTIDNTKAEITAEEIRAVVRQRHDITDPDKDDFAVTTMNEALEIVGTVLVGITGLLIALAGISLVVGGVGIMNVMYVSVAERTFEIGLRKSMGASEGNILRQFLVEAILITTLGGMLGILIGVVVSFLIAFGAQYAGYAWEFKISTISIGISVGFSTLVGLFFGLYPAKKAASLDPITALRKE
ncbi:MAG: FtsX-like permease family protein [Candidatus Magasanikbacteria bacterium]|jgi:putative ABC transport system permease protein|nr:FtsX-like permease family protein [Candidatus Magasanikbacteria bacterium]